MIKMPALVVAMEEVGFQNIRSYLQSGNLIFESSDEGVEELAERITSKILETFTLDVPVIVLDGVYLKQVREENPFLEREGIDETKLHATFLANVPDAASLNKINAEKYRPDEFVVRNKVVYLSCPAGYGTTKLTNNFFESKLKIMATTRNWNTVNKLVELSDNSQKI